MWAKAWSYLEKWSCPGCLVWRLADWPTSPASLAPSPRAVDVLSGSNWYHCFMKRRAEGGVGLRTNNRALSLEMSAVTSGDCPARQTHFHAKSQGTKHVENTMKFDGDSASERVGWTRTFTPAGMERKWERGQQAMGNNTDHVKSVSKQNKDFQLSVWSSKPIC